MSKVLYREYRPRNLDDVKGQDHIVNALKNALKNNSIAHAYLFTGSHGVGKTSVARILAHLINKLDYTGEDEHLDIIEIDAASNRRIDEIRELREKAFVAPTSAKYKVYIIDEVHMLTREAFNALLKTLEEPPEHAIFILATTEAHKVPRTIISRTQRFSFKPQDIASLESRLAYIAKKENIPIEKGALQLIARHSNGSFRDAISILDQIKHITSSNKNKITEENIAQIIGVPSKEILSTMVESLFEGDSRKLFNATEELRQQGISATIVSQELIRHLRERLMTSETHNTRVVGAMKFLLEHINSATYDTVEVALLQQMPKVTEAETKKEMRLDSTSDTVDHPDSIGDPDETSKGEEDWNQLKNTSNSNPDWVSILEALKGHHNTLYGILKMSKVTMDKSTIKLVFKFPFHEKQFLQTKHVSILKKVLKDKTTVEYTIKTSVEALHSTAAVTKSESTPKKSKKDDLSSISNIFSGAELLE